MNPSLQWFLEKFPVLSAAIVAVAGVIITQLCMFKLERKKQKNERRKDFVQRRFSFKRDIYIAVNAALMEAVLKLGKVPTMSAEDFKNYELSPDSMRALAAKDLIANREVTVALAESLKVLRQSFFSLVPKKNEELIIGVRLSILETQIASRQQMLARLNDELIQLDDKDEDNGGRRDAVYERFLFVNERLAPLLQEQSELISQRAAFTEELTRLLPPLTHACKAVNAKVSLAMRLDLGFSSNLRIADLTSDDDGGMAETSDLIEKSWAQFRTPSHSGG